MQSNSIEIMYIAVFWVTAFFLLHYLLVLAIAKLINKKINIDERIRLTCFIGLTLFIFSITIPYHVQGYSELSTPWGQGALGFAKHFPFSLFAFFFSPNEVGILWLIVNCGLLLTTFVTNRINRVIILFVVIFLTLSAIHMEKYHIIKAVG